MLASLAAATLAAEELSLRVRIAWGGGAAERWAGTVRVDEGTVADPVSLGIEADEPGSIWLDGSQLNFLERSPRTYDGVDVTITAPADARLIVDMRSADAPPDVAGAPRIEVSLRTLTESEHVSSLDEQGNRLLVRRAPGDLLRVRPLGDSLVYQVDETGRFQIEPHPTLLAREPGLRLHAQLYEVRSDRTLGDAIELDAAVGATLLEIPLPSDEGVYDLVVTAVGRRLPMRLGFTRGLAERRVQFVVLSPHAPERGVGRDLELRQLVEIDPATNPRWWERLTSLPLLPGSRRGPLGNGDAHPSEHPLGQLIQLGPRGQEPDLSWEAYTLPIDHTGAWHVLEVEYPSDVPQAMGISIVEPNAAGAVAPIGLDSGLYLPESANSDAAPEWRRHRLLFWPRTRTPMVLVTNRRDGKPAVYRKLRVLEGPVRLPRAFPSDTAGSKRLLAGYYDQPLFPENFGATESLDAWSGRSLDDWATFHQGATRLVEYLQFVGYGGTMINVLADGSSIYPSRFVEPTPRYDTGLFFDSGQDPIRKDVLEMLLRIFDREQLQFIAALDFSAPLPELERLLRSEGGTRSGLEWVGADGRTWRESHDAGRGVGPHYNTLDPRVQQAMIRVVRELASRYSAHRSLSGVALRLSANGYAQLPGIEWGFDDATIERFVRETGTAVPGAGETRFAERAAFLNGPARSVWLEWRATSLRRFYEQMQAEMAAVRTGLKLYLAGAQMLEQPALREALRPRLPRAATVEDGLRRVGIEPNLYGEPTDIVLLRPQNIAPPAGSSLDRAIDREFNDSLEVDRYFRDAAAPGALVFHRPQPARLPSFDARSPYRHTYTWLLAQLSPAGDLNRRRLVHAVAALDAHEIFDGGAMLPLGQEESLLDVVAVYRSLPRAKFETVGVETQPVTVRTLVHDGRSYLYLANDAPWPAHVELTLNVPAGGQFTELGVVGRTAAPVSVGNSTVWTIDLRPYDLVGGVWTTPGVRVDAASVELDERVAAELAERVRDVDARVVALQNQPPLDVLSNPGFESPPADGEPIPGWQVVAPASDAATLDGDAPKSGGQSVRLASDTGVKSLVSRSFTPPATGRISMFVWLRVADANRQPSLRLALEGKLGDTPYYRYALVGGGRATAPIGTEWTQYQFQVNDLPLEELSDLKVRFDLMEAGEVWIDEIELRHLTFTKQELIELSKMVHLADVKLRAKQYADCERVLDGYWPQFLATHVSLSESSVARAPEAIRPPAAGPVEDKASAGGLWDRVKRFGESLNPF